VAEVRAIHESGFERQEGDFYPTPAWVTECLLSSVTLRGPIWEPCCGDGALAKVLSAAGHEVVATDLAERGFGRGGVDLLQTSEMPDGCRALVTNPPYGDGGTRSRTGKASSLMLAFTEHTIRLARQSQGQLALLVRFQWIAGRRVASLLTEASLQSVIVLTRRIQWFDHGRATKTAQTPSCLDFLRFRAAAGASSELIFALRPAANAVCMLRSNRPRCRYTAHGYRCGPLSRSRDRHATAV
jgi:hypothetical protein